MRTKEEIEKKLAEIEAQHKLQGSLQMFDIEEGRIIALKWVLM